MYLRSRVGFLLWIGLGGTVYGDQPAQVLQAPAKIEGRRWVDGVVAQVDKEPPILHSQIQEKVELGPVVLVSAYPATEEDPVYKKALQDAINLGLVLKRARELLPEIKITPEEIDEQIRMIVKQPEPQKLDLRELEAFLQDQHKTMESFRKDLENQMIVMRFMGREILPLVSKKATPRDIEAFYLQQPGHHENAVEVKLKQILIAVDSNASPALQEEKKKWAQEAYLKLKGGMEFSTAIRLYSDPNAQEDSNAAPTQMKLAELPESLRDALSSLGLQPGSFTEPKLTPQGYRILYVIGSEFAKSEDFLRQEKDLEEKLRKVQREKELVAWLQKARNKAKIYLVH